MITEVERFQCSPEAEDMWSRLRVLYALKRAGLRTDGNGKGIGWVEGDTQVSGRNWAEAPPSLPSGNHSDLATDARLLFIACVGCLARLEEQGAAQEAGVALARRRLSAHGLGPVAQRFGLSWCGAYNDEHCTGCQEHDLLNMTKEWLRWALDDPLEDEPDLPWLDSVRQT